jgi:hypothetical protein
MPKIHIRFIYFSHGLSLESRAVCVIFISGIEQVLHVTFRSDWFVLIATVGITREWWLRWNLKNRISRCFLQLCRFFDLLSSYTVFHFIIPRVFYLRFMGMFSWTSRRQPICKNLNTRPFPFKIGCLSQARYTCGEGKSPCYLINFYKSLLFFRNFKTG